MLKDGEDKLNRSDVAAYINNFFVTVVKFDQNWVVNNDDMLNDSNSQEDLIPYSIAEVTEREVYRVIRSINVSKSSGINNINSMVIKAAFEHLIPEVTHMYNLSIHTTKFLNSWKKSPGCSHSDER